MLLASSGDGPGRMLTVLHAQEGPAGRDRPAPNSRSADMGTPVRRAGEVSLAEGNTLPIHVHITLRDHFRCPFAQPAHLQSNRGDVPLLFYRLP